MGVVAVDTIQNQHVEVDIEVGGTAKALDQGHCASLWLEPCAGKPARTVLRRVVVGNGRYLSDQCSIYFTFTPTGGLY